MIDNGVYSLTFLNGETYVGSSCDINSRFYEHLGELKRGVHPNRRLQSLYDTYGEPKRLILEVLPTLLQREQHWIDQVPKELLVNCGPAVPGAMLGRKHTLEARKKMSDATKGKPSPMLGKHLSLESRKKISETMTGMKRPLETRKKMSNANTGKHLSTETRKKISLAMKKRYFVGERQ